MKNIKTYEDFCNEEINLKKAVVGAALGASLLGGMSSCKKEDIKPCNHPTEQTQTQNVKVDVKINFKDYLNDNGPSFSNDIYGMGLSYTHYLQYGGTEKRPLINPQGWIYINNVGQNGIIVFWGQNGKLYAVDRKSPMGGRFSLGEQPDYIPSFGGSLHDGNVNWWGLGSSSEFGDGNRNFPGESNNNLLDPGKPLTFYNVTCDYSSGNVIIKN